MDFIVYRGEIHRRYELASNNSFLLFAQLFDSLKPNRLACLPSPKIKFVLNRYFQWRYHTISIFHILSIPSKAKAVVSTLNLCVLLGFVLARKLYAFIISNGCEQVFGSWIWFGYGKNASQFATKNHLPPVTYRHIHAFTNISTIMSFADDSMLFRLSLKSQAFFFTLPLLCAPVWKNKIKLNYPHKKHTKWTSLSLALCSSVSSFYNELNYWQMQFIKFVVLATSRNNITTNRFFCGMRILFR